MGGEGEGGGRGGGGWRQENEEGGEDGKEVYREEGWKKTHSVGFFGTEHKSH